MNILSKVDNMYVSKMAATYIRPDSMSEKPERHCGGPLSRVSSNTNGCSSVASRCFVQINDHTSGSAPSHLS